MLLRKRAWDLMRDGLPEIRENAGVKEIVQLMDQAYKDFGGAALVLVHDKEGAFRGVATPGHVLEAFEHVLFKSGATRGFSGSDWDHVFAKACKECAAAGLDGLMDERPPLVEPGDAMLVTLEALIKGGRGYVLVKEKGKVIGAVFERELFGEMARDLRESL
jgi:predicted transcriptional regulator